MKEHEGKEITMKVGEVTEPMSMMTEYCDEVDCHNKPFIEISFSIGGRKIYVHLCHKCAEAILDGGRFPSVDIIGDGTPRFTEVRDSVSGEKIECISDLDIHLEAEGPHPMIIKFTRIVSEERRIKSITIRPPGTESLEKEVRQAGYRGGVGPLCPKCSAQKAKESTKGGEQ